MARNGGAMDAIEAGRLLALGQDALALHGFMSHNAAVADLFLHAVFRHYAGCKPEISRAIYFTIESVGGRVTLTQRTAKAAGADTDTLKVIEKLGEAVKAVVSHRNGSAHSFLHLRGNLKRVNPRHEGN